MTKRLRSQVVLAGLLALSGLLASCSKDVSDYQVFVSEQNAAESSKKSSEQKKVLKLTKDQEAFIELLCEEADYIKENNLEKSIAASPYVLELDRGNKVKDIIALTPTKPESRYVFYSHAKQQYICFDSIVGPESKEFLKKTNEAQSISDSFETPIKSWNLIKSKSKGPETDESEGQS